jgi:hypothetical protein
MPSINALRPKQADARTDLAKQILSIGLAGLGAGVTGRSIMGLRNLSRPPVQTPFISPGPSPLPIPIPAEQLPPEEDPELTVDSPAYKYGSAGLYEGAANTLAQYLPEQQWSREAISVPALALTGGLGAVGGWKLTDWLLDKRRKAQLNDELVNAQSEYESALQSQFQPKMAAATDDKIGIGPQLDELFGVLEKSAIGATSGAAGAYLLAAALLGGGAAAGTYNWTKNRSPAAMLAKAQKERARQLWARSNQPVVAVPMPQPRQPAALGLN